MTAPIFSDAMTCRQFKADLSRMSVPEVAAKYGFTEGLVESLRDMLAPEEGEEAVFPWFEDVRA